MRSGGSDGGGDGVMLVQMSATVRDPRRRFP